MLPVFQGSLTSCARRQGFAGGGPLENSACLVIPPLFAFLSVATVMTVLK